MMFVGMMDRMYRSHQDLKDKLVACADRGTRYGFREREIPALKNWCMLAERYQLRGPAYTDSVSAIMHAIHEIRLGIKAGRRYKEAP